MRLRILAVAMVLQLAATACFAANITAGKHGKIVKLPMNEVVSAEITASSPINYNNGSRYQLYSIKLDKGQAVELELKGTFFGSVTVLQDGGWITSASSKFVANGSMTNLMFKSDQAGSYVVAVNGDGAGDFGPYQLRAQEIETYQGGALKPGQSIRDYMFKTPQEYPFTVAEAGLYEIKMSSNKIDSVIELQGEGVSAGDDDSGGGGLSDALLTRYLEPGDYTLFAGVAAGAIGGDFALSVQRIELSGSLVDRDGTELRLGEQRHGVLDGNSRRRFILNLDDQTELEIIASSYGGDMMLEISGNGVQASDDNGGFGMNAQLMQTLAPGRYEVVVTDLAGRGGDFFLLDTVSGEELLAPAGAESADEAEAAACAVAEAAASAAEAAACAATDAATSLPKRRR